jgi:hypothetical protein
MYGAYVIHLKLHSYLITNYGYSETNTLQALTHPFESLHEFVCNVQTWTTTNFMFVYNQ